MNTAKKTAIAFLQNLNKDHRILSKKDEFKANILTKIIAESDHFLRYNEWKVALECTLDNLYEYDIKISRQSIELAKIALSYTAIDQWEAAHLDELLICE
jgi:hypothetical protein